MEFHRCGLSMACIHLPPHRSIFRLAIDSFILPTMLCAVSWSQYEAVTMISILSLSKIAVRCGHVDVQLSLSGPLLAWARCSAFFLHSTNSPNVLNVPFVS